MRLFDFLHKYFGFNKRERNGLILLTGIIIILITIRFSLNKESKPLSIEIKKIEAIEEIEKVNDTKIQLKTTSGNFQSLDSNYIKKDYFSFDPNTISKESAEKLGLKPKLISTLLNFRSKGGKFKTKEDLKKLYGLNNELYSKLEPYILIPTDTKLPAVDLKNGPVPNKNVIVDINSADSAQIIRLPGIGAAYTRKILKFRNALGGFTKIEQLKEIYGMKDSTYLLIKDKILITTINIKKININTASIDEMKKHPYISYNVASTIVNYRTKHGIFKSYDQLLELGSLSPENYTKLLPYIDK